MSTDSPPTHRPTEGTSFAETALQLGGKSADEARRTGAIDTADDQVEALFAPQYQTVNSPAHRAVWDRGVPVELFMSKSPTTPPDVQQVMDDSIAAVQRHKAAGTLLNEDRKIADPVLADLGQAGYWGLLVGKEYGGSGAPFSSFAPFLTRMALVDPTVAGLASVHGCIGAVDPVRTFGNAEQKQRFLPGLANGSRLSAFALTEPCAGSDLTALAHDGAARWQRICRQRREAVHHECRAGPHDWVGMPDRRQAGGADRRIAGERERELSASQIWALGTQAYVQPRHHLQRLPRAGREPARGTARRWSDDRLSRPEPRPHRSVCERGRHDAADDGEHHSVGPLPPNVRRRRSPRANWCSVDLGELAGLDRRVRCAGRLVRRAYRPRLSAAKWNASSPRSSAAKRKSMPPSNSS